MEEKSVVAANLSNSIEANCNTVDLCTWKGMSNTLATASLSPESVSAHTSACVLADSAYSAYFCEKQVSPDQHLRV